ncbi:MAG: deoxyribodipyrimidine photo-lyase, partial [Nitrosopumilaceae archaeon]
MIEIQKERKYKKSIFVFRRDLRLEDNLGLYLALKNSEKVIPVFIYDEKLSKNLKKSEFRWNFLKESLVDLDLHLKKKKSHLAVYEGNPTKITKQIILEENIKSVFSNTDFSNYSKKRDSEVNKICRENNVDFNCSLDFLLHNPNEIKTDKGKPYTIYSHFVKKARQFPVRKILKNTHRNYFSK